MATFDFPPIHGRGSYKSEFNITNANIEVDLSGETIYLEIPASKLRVLLPVDPADPKQKIIAISRAIVETLPSSPSPYAIIDESDPVYPNVILSGSISRTGYIGSPIS